MAKKPRLGTDPLNPSGMDVLIQDTRGGKSKPSSKQGGRPKTSTRGISKTSQEGLREGWTRATFIMREDYLEKLKDLAYWDRKEIKEIVNEALKSYLKNKTAQPRPKEGK